MTSSQVIIEFIEPTRIQGMELLVGARVRMRGTSADYFTRRGRARLVEDKPAKRVKKHVDTVDSPADDSAE